MIRIQVVDKNARFDCVVFRNELVYEDASRLTHRIPLKNRPARKIAESAQGTLFEISGDTGLINLLANEEGLKVLNLNTKPYSPPAIIPMRSVATVTKDGWQDKQNKPACEIVPIRYKSGDVVTMNRRSHSKRSLALAMIGLASAAVGALILFTGGSSETYD